MCSFEAPQFKGILRNWRESCRWLSNFPGAYDTNTQGEVEGTGLVYSHEQEAKEKSNSKTRGNVLELQFWRLTADERKCFFMRKVEKPWNRETLESQSIKI